MSSTSGTGRDGFHSVSLVALWWTPCGEMGNGNSEASDFSLRQPAGQRTRWGKVRDAVERVLTHEMERVPTGKGKR